MTKAVNNFAGLNGYVWWMGVVEGIDDPLTLGRCQVRIFGWHTADKSLIPTADLPWALPVLPSNNSHDLSTPMLGDYVTGFFADSESGQFPIMLGVLPGILTTPEGSDSVTTVDIVTGKTITRANTTTSISGFQDPRTAAEIAAGPNPPTGQTQRTIGQPTTAPIARGVFTGTALEKAYNNRAHVCDITAENALAIAKLKSDIMGLIQKIRLAIEALFAGISASPVVEQIKMAITALKNKIKAIQKELKPIVDFIKAMATYIEKLGEIIKFIISLPQKLIELLKDCLSHFTSEITKAQAQLQQAQATVTTLVNTVSTATATLQTAVSVAATQAVNSAQSAVPKLG